MKLPLHKTKIVCTIGPACRAPSKLAEMIKSGMNVARLNFSHGDFPEHAENIRNIRAAARASGRPVGILIDLPGVKIRVGSFPNGTILLKKHEEVVLTVRKASGTDVLIPVEYKQLTKVVSKGSIIYLNDGFIQLKVRRVGKYEVYAKVLIGGKLLSHKGINLPGAKLRINPITRRDLQIVDFALKQGIHVFGLSFIESAKDIDKVRQFAKKRGKSVYLVAKIERCGAIENFDEILKSADAVMIARGDLGVEIPIEELPLIQKRLIQKANAMGRPVITATQMLESMTQNIRPTRAEVNDVSNAILDGTDAVMLSEETAIGDYPQETVRMMAKIAQVTELQREGGNLSYDEAGQIRDMVGHRGALTVTDVLSLNAVRVAEELKVRYILTPTLGGTTVRRISRFKPHCWILSFSAQSRVCDSLTFSYGVYPFCLKKQITNGPDEAVKIIKKFHLAKKGDRVLWAHSLGIVTL